MGSANRRRRPTRKELVEMVAKLKATPTYKHAQQKAKQVMRKHELAAIRSQQITAVDLAVTINVRD